MKSFKVLMVSFLSTLLIFSSTGLKAENLIHTVPNFYYLENRVDESEVVLVYACSIPVEVENVSIDENQSNLNLNCSIIVEVAASDLNQFTSRLIQERFHSREKAALGALGFGLPLISGFWGALNLISSVVDEGFVSQVSKKTSITVVVLSSVVLLGSVAWLRSDYGNIVPARSIHLAEQIHAGMIKDESGNPNLERFTDFLNQFGKLHHNN